MYTTRGRHIEHSRGMNDHVCGCLIRECNKNLFHFYSQSSSAIVSITFGVQAIYNK